MPRRRVRDGSAGLVTDHQSREVQRAEVLEPLRAGQQHAAAFPDAIVREVELLEVWKHARPHQRFTRRGAELIRGQPEPLQLRPRPVAERLNRLICRARQADVERLQVTQRPRVAERTPRVFMQHGPRELERLEPLQPRLLDEPRHQHLRHVPREAK